VGYLRAIDDHPQQQLNLALTERARTRWRRRWASTTNWIANLR
jgi:hypothetical protein